MDAKGFAEKKDERKRTKMIWNDENISAKLSSMLINCQEKD